MNKEENRKKLLFLISLLIIVVIIASEIGLSDKIIQKIIQIFFSLILGIITSAVTAMYVEGLKGGILKEYLCIINIGDYKFSISAFVLVTFIVELLIFSI